MPNNEPTNTKRATTLSAPADPRIDPRRKASKDEAEKVRHALGELRKRNTELSADIHSLETAIGEPAFRRLIDQVTSAESSLAISSELSSSTEDLKRQKIAQCKKVLGPKLSKLAGKGQTLHFGAVNPKNCLPTFFIAINSENRKLTAVSIVGPPDIKKRSSGALRVADEALSLDRSLISDLINKGQFDQRQSSTTKKNLQQAPHNGDNQLPQSAQSSRKVQPRACVEAAAERARNRVQSALARAAEQQPPLVVFGVLRRDAKIMALTGDWVQVQIVHLPNEPEGLGFGIVGGHSTGVVVKSLIRGSVADKDMRLRPGDRILQIGHISTQGLNSQQVAALLRQQNAVVQLTVVRPIQLQESDQDTPLCWTMSTRAALSADILDEEVQARLEAFAKSRNKSCNGLHHHPKCPHGHAQLQQQHIAAGGAAEALSEGTEYPDQLALHNHHHHLHYNHQTTTATTTEGTADAMMDMTNQPSTSTAAMQNECGGSHGHQIWAQSADKIGPTELLNSAGNTTSSSSRRRRGRTSRGPSNDNPSCSSSSDRLSLKQLQEMALTSFCRDKWTPGKFREIQIELERDKHIGLGITVAGYVYKKEEISGVFIKSLVPQSSAHLSRQIQLHDLIVEVNGRRLEGLSHAESVRTLIRSGQRVRLKLIRFEEGTPQAKCLKMLHEQELAAASQIESAGSSSTAATVPPIVQTQQQYEQSLVDYKSYWATRLGPEFDIVLVDVRPDERVIEDGGLGIEWQGTVDICDGSQLCSHHFIESMRKDGPAAKTGALKAGDELLQVNETALFGESFVRVRNELNSAQKSCQFVRLIFCRRAEKEHINFVMPSSEQSLPLAYPILATMMALDEHFIKAKSELRLADLASAAENGPSTTVRCRTASAAAAAAASRWKRSRSLENLSGFAVWHCVPIVVTLRKDARGLGFSVADYQDPSHPAERVIVIRSLVPGGAAQADGRIVPGDRLLFVNGEDLSSSSLERAVEVLKAAPIGQIVRLGIAKPVPIEQCRLDDTVPLISHSERLLAKSHSPRGRRRREPFGDHLLLNAQRHSLITSNPSSACSSQEEIWVGGHLERSLNPQLYFPSSTADSRCSPLASPQSRLSSGMQTTTAWSPCSSRSLSPCASPASSLKGSWSYDITNLPSHLERHIKVLKAHLPLGVVLDANVDKAINGCVVKSICSKKALAKDGRIQPVDHIVKVNGESLRNVTNAQARAIMRRANLVGAQCGISYITSSDAKLWKERFQRGIVEMGNLTDGTTANAAEQQQQQQDQLQSRLSPKVYPKFYRSPILDVPFESSESLSPSADTIAAITVVQVENFVDKLMKSIFADAMFDVYILDRPELQARHTVRPNRSASVAIEAAAVVEMPTVSMPTTTRRASMVQGLIRTASSSLKRKTPEGLFPPNELQMAFSRQHFVFDGVRSEV